jgi:hypothetical protein
LHSLILHYERKAILKILACAVALWVLPALALADDLVVGVVHDTDGYPVNGASVSLHQAGGAPAGSGKTGPDGTFGIDSSGAVATVEVQCAYCVTKTMPRGPGAAVVVLVKRFAALRDKGISAADARVLPYASVTSMASLMPFVVTTRGTISDRGLAGARSTVIADGIPLYRSADGIDLGTAIPSHAVATISETDPATANTYGGYSTGGLFSVDTLDASAGLVRGDASDGLDATLRAGGPDLRGALETSTGSVSASRGVLAATLPAATGVLDLTAVSAAGAGANANAFATTFALPVRSATLDAALTASRSSDSYAPENDNVAALSVTEHGVTFGVRGQRSSSYVATYGTGVQYDARAFIEAVHDDGRTRLFASLVAAQAGESLFGTSSANGAVLPTLSASTHLGPAFTIHADSVAALLPAPLYLLDPLNASAAISRSQLLDAGIGFDDSNRIHIDAMVFRQTVSGSSYGTTGGSGISTIWQIAPSLALRSWTLISHENGDIDSDFPGVTGNVYATGMNSLNRSVTWVTAGNVIRVDGILRGGYIEGDVSVPTSSQVRLVVGTRREGARRVYTAGLSWP